MPLGVALESVAVASGVVNIVGRIVNKRPGKKRPKSMTGYGKQPTPHFAR